MTVNRRRALSLFGLGGLAAGAARAAEAGAGDFVHGVASGDPLQDRLVLWTRVTPKGAPALVPVSWEVAEDAAFARIVAKGAAQASAGRDYTVKVDAGGLKPGREYHYRFRCGAAVSAVGRSRTLPVGALDKAVFAFVTCALYPNGYFNAYDHIARLERIDAVVELGDYIYEYGGADSYGMDNGQRLGRAPEPAHDLVTLADYRARHAQYKRDPDLQAAHARCAWICVWDDHEVANDDWTGGAENHHPGQGAWIDREAAALKAYYEWMPIREPEPGQAFEAINRSFQFGDLASLVMLESRLLARSYQLEFDRPQDIPLAVYETDASGARRKVSDPAVIARVKAAPAAPYSLGPDVEAIQAYVDNPERQMLGARQEQWLARELAQSVKAGKPWQVLGNQVVMARMINPDVRRALGAAKVDALIAAAPEAQRKAMAETAEIFSYPVPYDLDGWNGYPAARERVYDAIKAANGANTLILSGDSHAFWANQLMDASGKTRVAAEFGTSSITSPSIGDEAGGAQLGHVFMAQNPEVAFCDQLAKGYIRLTLTRGEAVVELIGVPIDRKPYEAATVATFRLKPASGPGVAVIEKI
jgi:alkaline phosphatase D